jgi:tetratricopeptide (TPR) repeat protein
MATSAELFEQALYHHQNGQLAQAMALYRQVLQSDPFHTDAYNKLGFALAQQGQLAEGIECFRQALRINPDFASALNNLGIAHLGKNQLGEAAECFRHALRTQPDDADAHCNLGMTLKAQGQLPEAIACYRQALRIQPRFANAYNNLGNALVAQGEVDEAIGCFRQALAINPGQANAHNNLGLALHDRKQYAEAIACFQQALLINPNYAQAYDNLGTALIAVGQLSEAAACFQRVLRIIPQDANALVNLGNTLAHQRLLDDATECFEKALQIAPGHSLGLWNRSLVRLLRGNFEGGWPGYEERWTQPGNRPQVFQQPRWDGSPLEGKTILVTPEQGLGDTIQFVRYLPQVKARGGHVILGCQKSLVNVLKGVAGADQIVSVGETLPHFDVQIPLLSLPGLFRTNLTNIPAQVPYLHAKGGRAARRKPAGEFHVGIAWQGSLNQPGDPRILPLKQFEPLAWVPGVRLFSLQIGPGMQELTAAAFPVVDLGGQFDPNALDDLAAALMDMDLVVSIDTAVAHLAGALGLPVWTLLCFAPDWRWLLDRSDSPWYPTMRLFRQNKLGAWTDVLERVAAELPLFSPGAQNQGASGS